MATDSQNPFSNVLSSIPGYSGYRRKEDRRDADRRVREQIANSLGGLAERVESIARSLADQRQITAVGPVDEFARSIRQLATRISSASYGYGGLFSDRNVDERALDQLRQFDESLLGDVANVASNVEKLEQAHTAGADLSAIARAGTDSVRQLNRRFDSRSEVIETAQPAPQASVASVISPAEAAVVPAIYNLHERDALTITGTNYVVDGRIDIQSGENSFRLFLIDASQKLWLLAPATDSSAPALVNESESSQNAPAGQVSFEIQRNDGAVTVSIDWSGEAQRFAGKELAFDEVEVYPAVESRDS